jgi:hypothetical protein
MSVSFRPSASITLFKLVYEKLKKLRNPSSLDRRPIDSVFWNHNCLGGDRSMIRAMVWFRCAAVKDPVQPLLVQPATIGWRARFREVDLTIERPFSGEELARRMKGWVTIDPRAFCRIVESHGWLKVFDDGGLMVEVEDEKALQALKTALVEHFGDQVDLEVMEKRSGL